MNKLEKTPERWGMARAFAYRDFVVFAGGNFAGALGVWVMRIALQWAIWDQTNSFMWLGILSLTQAAALVIAMPIAGALVDRFNRIRYGQIARSCEVGISITFTMLYFAGFDGIAIIICFAVLISFSDGMWSPARLAILAGIVPKKIYPAAFGTSGSLYYLSHFAGPAIAGILIAGLGIGYAFAFQAAMFALSLFAFLQLKTKIPRQAGDPSQTYIQNLIEGAKHTFSHRTIFWLILCAAVVGLSLRSINDVLAGYAGDLFGNGAEGLAMLASTAGFSALIAALYIGNFSFSGGQTRLILWGMPLAILAFLLMIFAPSFRVALIAYGLLAFMITIVSMSANILVQNTIEDRMRGRVMSLWGLVQFGMPSAGAWVIGIGVPLIGIRSALSLMLLPALIVTVMLYRNQNLLKSAETQDFGD